MVTPPVKVALRRLVWIPRSAGPAETCPRCKRPAASLTFSRALGWRCARCSPAVGQILVEFALIFPILALMLLAIAGVGIWLLAANLQASRATTLAAWIGAHPTTDASAYAKTLTACDWTATSTADLATVTITCPSWAHDLLGALPATIATTAVAFIPDASPSPSPSPSPTPSPSATP